MSALVIDSIEKLLVVGPVYDKIEVIPKVASMISDYDLIVFNGNVTYPSHDLKAVECRVNIMDSCTRGTKIRYNLGNYDLQLLKSLEETGASPDVQTWLQKQSNVIVVQLDSPLIITCGGITPQMTPESLQDNLETTFVSKIKDSPWHRWYGGAFGYVVSNNPLTQEEPQFYRFSAQIGNMYSDKNNVYAVEVSMHGLGNTILL